MEKSDSSHVQGLVLFSLVAALGVVADQLTKAWIRYHVPPNDFLFEWGFFRIINIQNTGAAFGIFQNSSAVLGIVSLIGAATVLVFAFLVRHHFSFLRDTLGRITLGLLLGGIVGNLIDRLRLGYVTDFLDFTYWPAFNIADASVVIGVILLSYCLLFRYKD